MAQNPRVTALPLFLPFRENRDEANSRGQHSDGHKRHSLVTGMKYALISYATRLKNENIPRGPLHNISWRGVKMKGTAEEIDILTCTWNSDV